MLFRLFSEGEKSHEVQYSKRKFSKNSLKMFQLYVCKLVFYCDSNNFFKLTRPFPSPSAPSAKHVFCYGFGARSARPRKEC